jgi:hypothetical protein
MQQVEIIEGNDVSSAFNNAGIGAGALAAVDYYQKLQPNCLVGYIVKDKEGRVRTVVQDDIRQIDPYHPICWDMDYIFESTVLKTQNYEIYFLNRKYYPLIMQDSIVKVEEGENGVLVHSNGQDFQIDHHQLNPLNQWEIENNKFQFGSSFKYKINDDRIVSFIKI